ncbi:MAG: hypothetical protein DMF92_06905 [Acidobacteria bacterium]|nr:MAG: hypothetical protein DMF92_06905 [Acidobacteriota bacterium]
MKNGGHGLMKSQKLFRVLRSFSVSSVVEPCNEPTLQPLRPLWYVRGARRDRHATARSDSSFSNPCCPRRWSMNGQSQALKELLLQTDEEFHELAVKHHELEDRLHELASKSYPSEPEQLEAVTLKKRKLQLKDRMEDILRRHRQAETPASSSVSSNEPPPPHVRPHARG